MEVHFSSVASRVSVVYVSLNRLSFHERFFLRGNGTICSTFKRKNLSVLNTLSLSLSLSSVKAFVRRQKRESFFLSVKSVAEGKTRVTYTQNTSERERIQIRSGGGF